MTMTNRRFAASGLLVLLALAAPVGAQQVGRITGLVNDNNGAPLSEVQVYIPNSGLGALTRQNGRYVMLNVPVGQYQLRAERIGFGPVTQQVTVTAGQATESNFTMATAALGLDEIVVTGTAGAARRREVGNTIAQIDVSKIAQRPNTVSDVLSASAPGVNILPGSGELGNASSIRLRGINSVSMKSNPIIYVDGVRMMNSAGNFGNSPDFSGRAAGVVPGALDAINPSDIERIEIIKGAAATTLYGTEASAGVIQIFTKKGVAGAPIWTGETKQKITWIQPFSVEPEPFARMDPWISKGHQQDYEASVRGGGQSLQYFVSGAFQTATGNLPSDSLHQWNVRGNFTFTPATDLNIAWNTSLSTRWQRNTPTSSNAQSIVLNTWRAEVNYIGRLDLDEIRKLLTWDFDQDFDRLTTGGTATYSPLPNLTNRFTIGYDQTMQEIRNMRPYGFPLFPQGGLYLQTLNLAYVNFDYVGTFGFDLFEGVKSNFSWGGQASGEDALTMSEWGERFPGAKFPTISSAATTQGFEDRSKIWNAGFFFQNTFDIRNRYFITVGARVDGNSAFGSGFGLQTYPKASASWVTSDESWWKDGWGTLKLRAAYGESGRAPGAFDAVRTWQSRSLQGNPAFVPRNVGNPDLGPEVTSEIEGGFDAAWLGDRLTAGVSYYHQITKDALFNVQQVPSVGFGGTQRLNVGEMLNSGFEMAFQSSPIRRASWGWDLGLNVTTNHSEVLEMGGVPPFTVGSGGMQGTIGTWVTEGLPIGVWRDRVVANPDEVLTRSVACTATITTDCIKYDLNVIIGPSQPTTTLSGSSTVNLPRGVSVSARGEYRTGHWYQEDYFSVARGVRSPLCYPYYQFPEGIETKEPLKTNIALKPNTPALWRARCTPSLITGAYWWDMTYFRLRNVTASVPMDFVMPERFSNAVLTMTLENPYLWRRDLPFGDPEAGNNTRRDSDAAPQDGMGIGNHRLPLPTGFTVDLRVTF
jgi:TonB-dependent starch-binding outer membrane protein SusC